MSDLNVSVYQPLLPNMPYLVVGIARERVLFAYAVDSLPEAERHQREELDHFRQ